MGTFYVPDQCRDNKKRVFLSGTKKSMMPYPKSYRHWNVTQGAELGI